MARKTVKKSKIVTSKYKPFVLYGKYDKKWALLYLFVDLCIGFSLGFMLQPYIVTMLTSYATSIFGN